MKYLKFTVSYLFLYLAFLNSQAQSLQEKYDEMLEKTETYEQYKVIPRTRLNAFWSETVDSLNDQATTINALRSEVATQQIEINSLKNEIAEIQVKLDESLRLNDSIYFIGIPFSKIGYHIMVWLIIAVLTTLGALSYLMFLRSNRITSKVKREYETLDKEFEEHKTNAREKQVKLKRDLQTAVNQLNERR